MKWFYLLIKKKDIVLDIGTNTGALLLYASKFKPKKLIGIDINEKALELAKENMKLNNITNVELFHAYGNTFRNNEEVDVVIFNPPYFKTLSSDKGSNKYLVLAKHEDNFPPRKHDTMCKQKFKKQWYFVFSFSNNKIK